MFDTRDKDHHYYVRELFCAHKMFVNGQKKHLCVLGSTLCSVTVSRVQAFQKLHLAQREIRV